jgi:GNAT superfamily N-acetyltransferase
MNKKAIIDLVNRAYRGEEAKQGWTTEADLLEGPRISESLLDEMLAAPGAAIFEKYDDAGDLVGCIYLRPDGPKLYLGMLTVSPKSQGGGWGKQMLYEAEDYARTQGCNRIYMRVFSVRQELLDWYYRHGYRFTGEVLPMISDVRLGIPNQDLEFLILDKWVGGKEIDIRDEKYLNREEVLELYLANHWSSAHKPEQLLPALLNSHTLITAYQGGKLVGLGNAISDGHLVVYYPHLVVHPDLQGQGIGRMIVAELQKRYQGFHQQMLVADGKAIDFYKKCGFERAGNTEPMWVYLGDEH